MTLMPGTSEARLIISFPLFPRKWVEAAWCSVRVRFTEWVLLASHETGRNPAWAGEPGCAGCPSKFQTSPTCSLS